MILAGKRAVLELRNSLETLEKRLTALESTIERIQKDWDGELLKLANAKDLMARASARLERAASRKEPEPPPETPAGNGDEPSDPSKLTNPFARRMLGIGGS